MSHQIVPPPAPQPAQFIPAPPARGNGMATAGFVLAIIGVVLCLIPIVNNVAFALALLGLVFGIIGLVRTSKGAPRKGLAIAAIVLSVVAGIGVIASQSLYGKVIDEVSDQLDDTPTAAIDTTSAAEDSAADAAAEEPAPADAAEAAAGTRENPYPAGTVISNEDWDLTIGAAHEGWSEIHSDFEFAPAPPEGKEFWLVPISGTYKGAEPATPWTDMTFAFVGDDGHTYDTGECISAPNHFFEVPELYTGATFEANACVTVPAGASGLFAVTVGWFSDPLFFTK